MDQKWIAIGLAPILGPIIWWILFRPGKIVHNFLWKRLPDGKLRTMLFKEVNK